jgi:predicted phage baseplate assembly protein
VADLLTGEIHFGDGIHGQIPEKGTDIKIAYRAGGGEQGNVPAFTTWLSVDTMNVSVENPFPATGGAEAETIEEAFVRFRKDFKVPYAGVTAGDYEYIARNTPGVRIARASARVTAENEVTVVIVPYSPDERPMPSEGLKKTVCYHVDRHRLITTAIRIADPDYVRVAVAAEIRVRSGFSAEDTRYRVIDALNRFFSPIRRQSGDKEWPFGRPVYQSEVYAEMEAVAGVECIRRLTLGADEGRFSYRDGNVEIGPQSLVYPGRHDIRIIDLQSWCHRETYE